jgi:hypothetical protein
MQALKMDAEARRPKMGATDPAAPLPHPHIEILKTHIL